MEIPDPVSSILQHKPSKEIWHLSSASTVLDAIRQMAEKNVGAMLVIDDGQLVGIISERDYTRKVILEGRSSKNTAVREIMSSPVISVAPDIGVGACLQLMTDRHIRHLPVIDKDNTVLGVVSIGDLVKRTISAQDAMIGHLERYITGSYTG